jgi:hypothetical protein
MWQCPECDASTDDESHTCQNCGDAKPPVPHEAADDRIVDIFSAADSVEAHGLCERLQDEGIFAQVVGDTLSNAAGCLPLGERTTPRIWVRESQANRAREIISEWRLESSRDEDDFTDRNDSLEEEDSTEIKSPADTEEGPIPSDVRFHFLHQGFFIAAIVCVALGSIWAWKNSMTRALYAGMSVADCVRSSHDVSLRFGDPEARNLPLQPFPAMSSGRSSSIRAQYVYSVNGKIYCINVEFENELLRPQQMPIRYNPDNPADSIAGSVAPPWLVLLCAFGMAGFLSFVGYQFR